jgi:PLP dependent protein
MSITPEQMQTNIASIRARMANAAIAAGRKPEDIQLCAACKTQNVETIAKSALLDIDIFGENHVQELVVNSDANAYAKKPVHFIGHLQTNKIKKVLGRVTLIQSVDSEHLLLELEKEAAKKDLQQDILVEVNIGAEQSKTGLAEADLFPLLERAIEQEHLHVCGLMAIPPVLENDTENRRFFERIRLLAEKAAADYCGSLVMDTLSMGMSSDFENAIREGSTIVRVGTAIYGPRHYA